MIEHENNNLSCLFLFRSIRLSMLFEMFNELEFTFNEFEFAFNESKLAFNEFELSDYLNFLQSNDDCNLHCLLCR